MSSPLHTATDFRAIVQSLFVDNGGQLWAGTEADSESSMDTDSNIPNTLKHPVSLASSP